jgi:hypothetical protein
MRTEPVATFNSDVSTWSFHIQVGRLKHSPFVPPNEADLFLRELILCQESDNPSKKLPFVRIVEIIIIVVSVFIVFWAQLDILDICNGPDFASCLIEEYASRIFDHELPIDFIKPLSKLWKDIRIFLLPDLTESEGSPEHLAIIQSGDAALEVMSRMNTF